ncbi:MAG: phosphatase PAP2 family protein [Deltaproteobacteria bacterium]|nr:MAG: phosphatase PAP2 family protein [Deltaproteobacteria bacterium]
MSLFTASQRRWWCLALALCSLKMVTGCGTLANGRGWGQDATLFPGWERVGKAALNAALEPETWAPAVGAAVFQIGSLDRNLTNWASKRTPIFQSRDNADIASEALQATSEAAAVITALATPSGEESSDWTLNKAKGLAVGIAAVALTEATTDLLKYTTNRTRPDNSGRDSFPSGHASRTAACNTLAARNLQSLEMPGAARVGLRSGFLALTLSTGWARLESKKHYPSDVLAGMALGHFLGAFINDAFLGLDRPKNFFFSMEPSKKDIFCTLRWIF